MVGLHDLRGAMAGIADLIGLRPRLLWTCCQDESREEADKGEIPETVFLIHMPSLNVPYVKTRNSEELHMVSSYGYGVDKRALSVSNKTAL